MCVLVGWRQSNHIVESQSAALAVVTHKETNCVSTTTLNRVVHHHGDTGANDKQASTSQSPSFQKHGSNESPS